MIMNRNHLYAAVVALSTALPVLADINVPAPRALANAAAMQGNCDLLASNTVRATFRGLRDMPVQTLDQDSPTTAQVAVFEVIENLAYRKYVRYGDGQLVPGTRFTVAMNRELPGQPAKVVDTIAQMQPGEESVMRIDHLYLMGGQEGTPIRACSRMASRKAVSAAQDTAAADVPTTAAPLTGSNGSVQNSYRRESVSMHMDANGNVQTARTVSEYDPASGKVVTRMFINDQEVDPQTRQPLAPAPAAAAKPASSAAPASAAQPVSAAKPVQPKQQPAVQQPVAPQPAAPQPEAPQGDEHDDTVIEGDQPQPAPAPQQAEPAPQPAPAPAPASEEDGF